MFGPYPKNVEKHKEALEKSRLRETLTLSACAHSSTNTQQNKQTGETSEAGETGKTGKTGKTSKTGRTGKIGKTGRTGKSGTVDLAGLEKSLAPSQ